MRRIDTPELLDEADAPQADVERSLRDLQRINRWLGGIAIYRRLLRKLTGGGPVSILDLGTGSSDLLASLPAGRLKVGLDFKIEHLLYARGTNESQRTIARVVGDAMRLPFRDGSVDVVTSAHFFHHFTPEENVAILRDALRVARVGVAVNDTLRNIVPLLFVRLLSLLRLVGRITRADAPASVMRGYLVPEAREIAAQSGARSADVVHLHPFRFGIMLRK